MRSKIFLVDSILNNCYFECPDHSTSSSETFAQQTWKINCALLMLPLFFIITLIRNNGLSWLNQLIANQRRSAGRSVKSSGKKNLERGKAGAGHYLLYLSLRHILQVNGLVPKVHFPVFKPLGEQNITYTWTLFRKYAIFCIT